MTNRGTRTRQHVGEPELRALAANPETASPDQHRHLGECRACASLLEFLASARSFKQAAPCPDADQLTRYVESRSAAGSSWHAAIDLHLSLCLDCALETEGLLRLADPGAALPTASRARKPARPSLIDRLRALAVLDLPVAIQVTTRGLANSTSTSEHAAGMAAYRAGRLGDARRLLRAAQRAGANSSGLSFYLGLLDLERGAAGPAVREFERAVRARPRLGMYRWYLAQALLLHGDGKRALAALKRTANLPGAYAERARVLAGRLEHTIESD